MRQDTRRWKAGALCSLPAIVAALVTTALANATVQGDAAAWAEIINTYAKLNALPGYRVKITSPGEQLSAVREVVPGKASHVVITEGSANSGVTVTHGIEIVTVGNEERHRLVVRGQAGKWLCGGSASPGDLEPADVRGTVRPARGPDTTIDGARVYTYAYAYDVMVEGRSITRSRMIYVGTKTGLPRRSVEQLVPGPYILDYYDYGAKVEITLPPCG